jgi:TonB family protein
MTAQKFGESHRSIANKMLWRTLAIGLGSSTLLHTVAIAGVTYIASNSEEATEITMIERVEVDPDPVPTSSTKPIAPVVKLPTPPTNLITPIAKPVLAPEPKVVKPIVAAVPTPKPVTISTPQAITTPAPVVKIVKAKVPIDLPTKQIAKVIPPQEPTQIVEPSAPVKTTVPKTDRSQPTTKTLRQSAITDNRPVLGNTSLPSTIPAPGSNDSLDPNPTDESTPAQPGNNNKLARFNKTAPSSNNQTGLASSASNSIINKAPQGLGQSVESTGSNAPNDEEFGIGSGSGDLPGNNARIANSRSSIAGGGTSSNQIGLGGIRTNSPNIGDGFRTSEGSTDGFSSTGGSGDGLGGNGDSFISGSGTPGNNGRIARDSGGIGNGGNGTGTGSNRTGLGGGSGKGGRRTGSQFGSSGGTGNSDSYSDTNGNDELGTGTPGNIATGGNNQLSIQCLSNCEIRYPDNLEVTDTGKDKMLVKVTINANGRVTNAQIARSSGNQKLDSVTLAGVKQMQLTAMGKPLTFKIKVSTLANN